MVALNSLCMPDVKQSGAPDAGNPHVRCDEGLGRPVTYRASRLLYW